MCSLALGPARHLSRPARLFGPSYLEMFTQTPWYVVPLVWAPITITLFYKSLAQQSSDLDLSTALGRTMACFFVGNFVWTLLEYTLHRFLFHIEEALPDRPSALTLHFLLHGIHHYLPVSDGAAFKQL